MLRNMPKTVGSAIAALCLVSTLAMAQTQQPQSQTQQPQTQTQYPSQPMAPQTGNTTPQQGHRQTSSDNRPVMQMTCVKDNGKGVCTAATGADGKEIIVNGEGLKAGAMMNCVDRGSVVDCEPAS